ncbi:hypothetical protein OXX80_013378 [Metschnikowia pulcherrima]
MYTFAAPQNFVDNTDLDMESEWNTQYVSSSSESSSPLFSAEEPESPTSELLYECAFCMSSHSPTTPCDTGYNNYTLQLPKHAHYTYQEPIYVEEKEKSSNTFLESNYRKWLVSVTPR